MNTFKKWHTIGFSALMCLLVVACSGKIEIIGMAKQASKAAFMMGYDCADAGRSKTDCGLFIDAYLANISNDGKLRKELTDSGIPLPTGKYN